MAVEDRDLHSDLVAAYEQISHLQRVLELQTELLSELLDRRREPSGMAGVVGLDRRDRRER